MPVTQHLVALTTLCFLIAGQHGLAEEPSRAIYDNDPNHLWNRVFATLIIRTGPDGKDYGHDRLEPLLWRESDYLLKGPSSEKAISALEEFNRTNAESLVDDPVKRAMFQRDLWHVANWIAENPAGNSDRLLNQLATAIHRLALSPDQIARLPDNYALAVASKKLPPKFDTEKLEQAYLPPDLFNADGPWVCVARTNGRTAPLHLQQANAFANSTFFVFVKLPDGRDASLKFLKQLAAQKKPLFLRDSQGGRSSQSRPNPDVPQLPAGTELALVRRAMLIASNGQIVASPITEGVQLRVYRTVPDSIPATADALRSLKGDLAAFDIQLRRMDLFAGVAGGLRDASAERDFKTGFASKVWDEFDRAASTGTPFPGRALPFVNNRESCVTCHNSATVYSTMTFQRYWSPDEKRTDTSPPLFPVAPMKVADVEKAAIDWKQTQPGWLALRKLLPN